MKRRYWKVIALSGAAASTAGIAVALNTTESSRALPSQRAPLVLAVQPPDSELLLKANLHDLANGTTCAQRLAAVEALRSLGDKRAVPALKKARTRMRGGFLGFGGQNVNQCLRAAADAAIRELEPEPARSRPVRK